MAGGVSALEKDWEPDSEEESTCWLACRGVSGWGGGICREAGSMIWKNFKLDSAAATRRNCHDEGKNYCCSSAHGNHKQTDNPQEVTGST